MTVPLVNGVLGPISVKTAGGTSAALTFGLTGITSVALSGTPANAAVASANSGQAVTLTGSGLSTSSDILLNYVRNSGGTARTVLLNPTAAAGDGTSATLVVPVYANGVTDLRMLGSSTHPTLLQIVPTLTSYNVDGTDTLRLFGSGFMEGSPASVTSYNFAGGTATDTVGNSGVDVYNVVSGSDNTAAYLPSEPVHGFGNVTVTTAGGTSAPLSVNELQTQFGLLRSIAFSPANPTQLWVADNGNPAQIRLIDTTTGQQIRSIPVTKVSNATNSIGNTTFFGGLQVVPTAMTLNGTAVPAGSLLAFYGPSNPDYVVALNPTTGNAIASLALAGNYDTTAGIFDPTSGHLFVLDRNHSGGNRIVEIAHDRWRDYRRAGDQQLQCAVQLRRCWPCDRSERQHLVWLRPKHQCGRAEPRHRGGDAHGEHRRCKRLATSRSPALSSTPSGNLLAGTNQGAVLRIDLNFDPAVKAPTLTQVIALASSWDGGERGAGLGQCRTGDRTGWHQLRRQHAGAV